MASKYISQSGRWSRMMFKCNQFPTLTSYADAKQWHDHTIPMRRGYHKGKRPIHDRNRGYWHIVDTGEHIAFRENDRTIVAWLPNGEIHVTPIMFNCCYEQLTSLLDTRFFRKDNKLWVNTHQTLALHCNEANIFKRDSSGYLQLTNPPTRTKKAIDRAVAKRVRDQYKEFREYVKTTYKIRDEGYSIQECAEVFGQKEHWRGEWYAIEWPATPDPDVLKMQHTRATFAEANERFVRAIQNPDAFYMASLILMNCARAGYYHYGDTCKPKLERMLHILNGAIYYYHRDEVFVDKEMDAGDTSRDIYAHFFK